MAIYPFNRRSFLIEPKRFLLPFFAFVLAALLTTYLILKPTGVEPSQPQMPQSYGQLSLGFEANQGQADPEVKFISRGQGYTLFLTASEAVLSFNSNNEPIEVVRMKLAGANQRPEISGIDELPGKSNYFSGSNQSKWVTNVPNFAKVKYKDVYPGIDMVYYGNQSELEYDFVVAPNADPGVISLEFIGAENISVNAAGELVLQTPNGEVKQKAPVTYQEIGGGRNITQSSYKVLGENKIGFNVGEYNKTLPLAIDPTISYSRTVGGGTEEVGHRIEVDASGNAYITGFTRASNFPTVNPYQGTIAGSLDAFITKLSPSGAILYSTYFGGTFDEKGYDIDLDPSGNIFIVGETHSDNFPILNGNQTTRAGQADAFFAKFNSSGTLSYSTYMGGSLADVATALAVDASGNAYIAGETNSGNFPVLNAYQPANAAYNRVDFAAKILSDNSIAYSTYIGGSLDTITLYPDIAVDADGNAYITGRMSSGIPTINGFQTSPIGGYDPFILKLDPTGTPVYGTYFGGSSYNESGHAIAVDPSGNIYVAGHTDSSDFPILNAFKTSMTGHYDGFLVKVSPDGSLGFSTYLGGNAEDRALGLDVSPSGSVFLTGITESTNFHLVNAIQTTKAGSYDSFLMEVTPAGTVAYSTYLGGESQDSGDGIAFDALGAVYVTGTTESYTFPVYNAPQQNTSPRAVFITKFDFNPANPNAPTVATDDPSVAVNEGSTVTNTGTYSDPDSGDNVTITASVGVVNKTGTNSGTWSWSFTPDDGPAENQTVVITANDGNGGSSFTLFGLVVKGVAPTAIFISNSPINEGSAVTLTFSNQSDVSTADSNAGFLYSYDCIAFSGFEVTDSPSPTYSGCVYPSPGGTFTAQGQIKDKDGFRTTYSVTVVVNNVSSNTRYSITELQTPGGPLNSRGGLNNHGQITGIDGDGIAYIWANGQATVINHPNSLELDPYAINNLGQILSADPEDSNKTILWDNGVVTNLGSLGGGQTHAYDINDSGQIVGSSSLSPTVTHAFLWESGNMTDLGVLALGPSSQALGINSSGQIVGDSRYEGNARTRSFIWENGVMTGLNTLGVRNFAILDTLVAVNDLGHATGRSNAADFNSSNGGTVAIIYKDGAMTRLGSLIAGQQATPTDINNFDQVVGESSGLPFLWEDGVMTDLNDLIPGGSGWVLNTASEINDSGQIIGQGEYNGETRVFLLTPLATTPTGSNITVQANLVDVTYTGVSTAGTTTVAPILPAAAGTLPGGYEIVNASVAYEITTTASIASPITICFNVPSVNNQGVFDSLRVLHNEGGVLVDRTILPPDSPAPDFATRTICARVSSLSPFVIARFISTNSPPVVGVITAPINPIQVNTVINASANFTDSGTSDTHTALWNWGDGGTSPGIVTETSGSGSVSGSHIYAAAGVYAVTLTVTDNRGSSGQSLFQFIVIYNPNGGFVTGGGWINSPPGAYVPAPSLTGKANFGFVSKYQNGASVPTGNTEFQFKAAGLNFKSTSYEWMVVAGMKAQYKGFGTINGQGSYRFMLTAIDGQQPGGGGQDKLRIKIWSDGSGLIYDNQINDPDSAGPTTALGGGSIVIHK